MSPNLSPVEEPRVVDSRDGLPPNMRYVRFGPFQVDQHREEVTQNGARLRLQGKVYQALLALLEKEGEVVTREDLRMRLWPAETQVNYDANVNTTINKLRQALGDSSDRPIYIETIPRKGYCLLAKPEYADVAVEVTESPALANENSAQDVTTAPFPKTKSDIWVTVGIIGLVLAGMLLGAGLTRLWLWHFSQF
jgi:DNA-binding winged helix-turn-helix (wHTH) protein